MSNNNSEAVREKDLGNEAYKKKDFATAHKHYDKAIELDPHNIAFHTNKAAAYFEEQKYDECIDVCKKAVEMGREHQGDFKLIAKSLARCGNAYLKKGDEKEALSYFEKSLSEFRDPALITKVNDVQKIVREKERLSYIDPAKALEEKEQGNECFKKGQFPQAIKHYSEAIKRDPTNAVLYSNRAACYTKLMEFRMALADCDAAIKHDPKFVKAHIRKGAVLLAMKETGRAARAYEDALQLDRDSTEARDGLRQAVAADTANPEEARKRAMNDPEIQAILGDPAMRLILEHMSTNPKSIQEHMKNPEIREKLAKLVDAGIVQVR